ncbi:MAG: O-antigen ligase family protein, partial [Candidatus Cloacimonetes bacterium]|nr:O-antigen ligase family protein [Candidatus Cloacimonadota bacterium]
LVFHFGIVFPVLYWGVMLLLAFICPEITWSFFTFGSAIMYKLWLDRQFGIPYNFFVPILLICLLLYTRNNFEVKKIDWHRFFMLILFIAYLTFSCIVSSQTSYGLHKVRVFVVNGCVLLITFYLFSSKVQILSMLKVIFLLGFVYYIVVLMLPSYSAGQRLSAVGINPIWFARGLGMSIVTALFLGFWNRNVIIKLLYGISSIAFFYYTLRTGSRGPLVALLGSIIFAVFVYIIKRNSLTIGSIAKMLLSFLLILILLFSIMQLSKGDGTSRIMSQTGTSSESGLIRLFLLFEAWQMFKGSPIVGQGFGAYLSSRAGYFVYPHNIIMELLSETGIVGLAMFVLLIWFAAVSAWKHLSTLDFKSFGFQITLYFSSMFVYYMLNAQVSGDISMNLYVFMFMGALWATEEWSPDVLKESM